MLRFNLLKTILTALFAMPTEYVATWTLPNMWSLGFEVMYKLPGNNLQNLGKGASEFAFIAFIYKTEMAFELLGPFWLTAGQM